MSSPESRAGACVVFCAEYGNNGTCPLYVALSIPSHRAPFRADQKVFGQKARAVPPRLTVHPGNILLLSSQVRILENRLDKALTKFNEALAHNKTLRQEVGLPPQHVPYASDRRRMIVGVIFLSF